MAKLLDLNQVYNESNSFCDWNDKKTLAAVCAINEAEKNNLTFNIAQKLYDNIAKKSKIASLDFGEITRTKGNITILSEFNELKETIDVLNAAYKKIHLKGNAITIVTEAFNNLLNKRKTFMSAFCTNNNILMDTYKFGTASVIAATSLITISLTNYFLHPEVEELKGYKEYDLLSNNTLFINLEKFNEMCKTNGLEKVEKGLAKIRRNNFIGIGTIAGASLIIVFIFNLVDILRELVYYFLFVKASMSEYFYINSIALETNAIRIKNNNKPAAKTQEDFATIFRQISNKLRVNDKEANYKAKKALKTDKNKYKVEELSDELPDASASNSSDLF